MSGASALQKGTPARPNRPDRLSLRKVAAKLANVENLSPPVAASPPTVTWSSARTVTTFLTRPDVVCNILGAPGVTFESSTGKLFAGNSTIGLDLNLYGDTFEFGWSCQSANAETVQIFVDGQPLTASSVHPSVTTAAGNFYFGKLVFGAVGQHRITVFMATVNALLAVGTTATGYVTPAPKKPRIAIVSDSWLGGAAPTSNDPLLQFNMPVARTLGADVLQEGIGGTGYTTSQPFGQAARISRVQAFKPDLIAFLGSRNDSVSGLQTAAAACYAAYAAACPNVPQIVFGPQPGAAVETVASTFAGLVGAVQAAALAAPNVIAFHDMIGSAAGAPAAYNGGTIYPEGSLVSYLGAVWRWTNNGTSSGAPAGIPGSGTVKWQRVTWGLTGTGNAGTVVGDGTRDALLGSDGIHLTPAGEAALGLYVAQMIRDDVIALAP